MAIVNSDVSKHSFWGSYAAADLPNLVSSPNQDTKLSVGNTAYNTTSGQLMVCTSNGLNSAVWASLAGGGAAPQIFSASGSNPTPNAVGDQYYNVNAQLNFVWDGTYWLSTNEYITRCHKTGIGWGVTEYLDPVIVSGSAAGPAGDDFKLFLSDLAAPPSTYGTTHVNYISAIGILGVTSNNPGTFTVSLQNNAGVERTQFGLTVPAGNNTSYVDVTAVNLLWLGADGPTCLLQLLSSTGDSDDNVVTIANRIVWLT